MTFKSVQIRYPLFHELTCTTIAFRALLNPVFYAEAKIRFPSPTPAIILGCIHMASERGYVRVHSRWRL